MVAVHDGLSKCGKCGAFPSLQDIGIACQQRTEEGEEQEAAASLHCFNCTAAKIKLDIRARECSPTSSGKKRKHSGT